MTNEPSKEGNVRVERQVRRGADCICDLSDEGRVGLENDCMQPECRARFAILATVNAINKQLREHGVDMQFDPGAFIPKWCA